MVSIRRKFSAFTLSSEKERITLRLHPDCCELLNEDKTLVLKAQDMNLIAITDLTNEIAMEMHLAKCNSHTDRNNLATTLSFLDTTYEINFTMHRYISVRRGLGRVFHIDGKSKSQELDTYLPAFDIALVLASCHLSKELDY